MADITRTTPVAQLPEYLSIAEVATYLGIGRGLCYELARQGELPSIKLGRLLRVRRDALADLQRKRGAA
jgi:excisionase family DNA binding protein